MIVIFYFTGSFHVKLGQDLNDNQWHYVALDRKMHNMEMKLDNHVAVKAFIHDNNEYVQMTGGEHVVYFGGVKDIDLFKNSSISQQNFKGCLQQVYFNRHDVVSKILNGIDWRYSSEGELNDCQASS